MDRNYLMMVCAVTISSFSQIILKKSAQKKHESFLKEYLNLHVFVGYGMMVISTLMIIFAYKDGLDYKNGPVIESLGYVLVMILSYLFFRERVGKRKIIGYGLILVGVIIFYL